VNYINDSNVKEGWDDNKEQLLNVCNKPAFDGMGQIVSGKNAESNKTYIHRITEQNTQIDLLQRKLTIAMECMKKIEEHEHCTAGMHCQMDNNYYGYPSDSQQDAILRDGLKKGHLCCASIAREAREEIEKL
jgi:hypothetical protein